MQLPLQCAGRLADGAAVDCGLVCTHMGFCSIPAPQPSTQVVCGQLLHALVRRPAVCAALLDTPAWGGLCDAVGRGDAGLLQLAEKVQRRLLQSLLLAAHGLPGDAGNWAGRLLESTAAQLRQAGASEAAARAALQRADGLHLVVSLLERLRGAVRGATPSTQAALFQQVWMAAGNIAVFLRNAQCRFSRIAVHFASTTNACCTPPCPQFTSVAPALATLFDACRTQPVAVTLILKLVRGHAGVLTAGGTPRNTRGLTLHAAAAATVTAAAAAARSVAAPAAAGIQLGCNQVS